MSSDLIFHTQGEFENMPVASLPEVMDRAFEKRYGVAAFNTVDDITMDGVIRAAEQSRSPLIVQISVKTVKFWGAEVIHDMFTDLAGRATVPVALHLDHCPDPEVARSCLKVGWNSVLFDGSGMSFEENQKLTKEIVAFANTLNAAVEGEVVAVAGVEDGMGSEEEGGLPPIEKELEFIADTGIYCYAPPIGTAHGFYKAEPKIRYDRMEYLVKKTNMPMVLHGGTGLNDEVYSRLIALGAAKVNISTALKKTYADGFKNYLEKKPAEYDPLKLIGAVRNDVVALAQHCFKLFGSEGQA
jgi:fructose-bisphosphate aldolase class II